MVLEEELALLADTREFITWIRLRGILSNQDEADDVEKEMAVPPQAPPHQDADASSSERVKRSVPLASLLGREVRAEKVERPRIRHGQAGQQRKGEDYAFVQTECQRIRGDSSSAFAVFAIFDGHNGDAAAIYSRDSLLNDVLSAIPPGLSRDDWLAALPRALVAGFVKTDKDFQKKGQCSGTTVTFVVVDGWTVTVASVGDSHCILECQSGFVSMLTADHRLEVNVEERDRVTASGGEVGRLSTVSGVEIGPLRCWPGGLCLSRSIGDMDVGEFIVPVPHVKQIKLSRAGGRLIIASDGVWDSVSYAKAAKCSRGLPAELAAKHIVKEAIRSRGLRDDTTCLVVDLIPPSNPLPSMPLKTHNKAMCMFVRPHKCRAEVTEKCRGVGIEELFEEGSAMLSERLGTEPIIPREGGLLMCAICQADITPSEGISGSSSSMNLRPCEGPLLCLSCNVKKDAMEGKRS